ncbi:hypothetical protein EGI26_05075 [Lacihabitans sp. CCS-44]|uniref:hypothetical protein n=1 Tax=Lacihabitans sp. CCS-44 TaxID=2487331 RepID=UPI0020CCE1A6|nr:hypothetical protein [Lacihabitans sp. CCS-44]MCP9754536.1 hypothetical protein [Lacihabitans sp. CCS-44]
MKRQTLNRVPANPFEIDASSTIDDYLSYPATEAQSFVTASFDHLDFSRVFNQSVRLNGLEDRINPATDFWQHNELDKHIGTYLGVNNLTTPELINSTLTTRFNQTLNIDHVVVKTGGVANLCHHNDWDRPIRAFTAVNNLTNPYLINSALTTGFNQSLQYDKVVVKTSGIAHLGHPNECIRPIGNYIGVNNLTNPYLIPSTLTTGINQNLNFDQGAVMTSGIANMWHPNEWNKPIGTYIGVNNLTAPHSINSSLTTGFNQTLNFNQVVAKTCGIANLWHKDDWNRPVGTFIGVHSPTNDCLFNNAISVGNNPSLNADLALNLEKPTISKKSALSKGKIIQFLDSIGFKETINQLGFEIEIDQNEGINVHFNFHIYSNISGSNHHIGNKIYHVKL